jgi:hypothetical protein
MKKTITKLAIALGIATNLTHKRKQQFRLILLHYHQILIIKIMLVQIFHLVLQIFNTIGKDIGQMEQPIQM